MTKDDALPTQVCLECIRKLNVCHDFVNLCVEADRKLKILYKVNEVVDGDEECYSEVFVPLKYIWLFLGE